MPRTITRALQRISVVSTALLYAFLLLSLSACTDDGLRLSLQPKVGFISDDTLSTQQKITQTVMGQDMETEQNVVFGITREVVDVAANGDVTLRMTYKSVKVALKQPFGELEYDSTKNEELTADTKPFQAMVGRELSLVVSPAGEVREIKGPEELIAAMLEGFPEQLAVPMREQFEQMFGEVALKASFEPFTSIYPPTAVKVGDTWTIEHTMTPAMGAKAVNVYELMGRENGVAQIAVTTTLIPKPGAEPLNLGGMNMKVEMKGTMTGTLGIEEATGMVVAMDMSQDLSGVATVGEEGGAQEFEIPQVISGRIVLSSDGAPKE